MRESGILMHITSLPGPYGIGTMGKTAYQFIDFLRQAGQSFWQVLPVTPTGYGDSPYQSCSTFAGNHYLIDPDLLVQQGLLKKAEVKSIPWGDREDRVDFGLLYSSRLKLLRLAYQRFAPDEAFDVFCRENQDWIWDFAMFMALKEQNGGKPWYQWDDGVKFRRYDAMTQVWEQLQPQIRFYCFVQYLFDNQWTALRDYAAENGVRIIGDVPIYVPYDSADVWGQPALFDLNEDLTPVTVAGCPPDSFNADGQLWGNPLYRWDVHKAEGYRWWIRRMAAAGKRYDMTRLDHFRGFESYWAVPYGDETARGGRWLPGPGADFIKAIKDALPGMRMIAEDLGFLTEEVHTLRQTSGYPGMKVLQFAFDPREPSDYLPHTYTANSVCYTGTHDNMTTLQWAQSSPKAVTKYATEYLHITPEEGFVWGMIRGAMASVSDLCVIPMQDYLELGAEARMNLPGTQSGSNWTWRAKKGFTNAALAKRIRALTALYGRLNDIEKEKETSQTPHLQ